MILCQRYCAEDDIMIFEHTQYSTKSEINGMTRVKYRRSHHKTTTNALCTWTCLDWALLPVSMF